MNTITRVEGPSQGLRAVVGELEWTRTADARADRGNAEDVLARIERDLGADVESNGDMASANLTEDGAWDVLSAIHAWAGVASAAVSQV
jgi:hypothetical protein